MIAQTLTAYSFSGAAGSGVNWPVWYGSHIRGNFEQGVDRSMDPEPDGLVIAYLNGSVDFAKWKNLTAGINEG